MRHLMSAKAKEQKQEEIVVVRDFPKILGLDHQLRVYEDDILKTGRRHNGKETQEEHEMYLGLVFELLKKEKLYFKFSKCEFWLQEVQFLVHVINGDGIHVDHSKIEAVKNWEAQLFNDYDCEIRYHPGKANVVADTLSRKERIQPRGIRPMNMTLQSSIKDKILVAQEEASDEFTGL
ncbi:hypothetical protein Tco_0591309 [Tanacetum coccineum]